MDLSSKKFSVEKALFRLDCEFSHSVPFKLYKFASKSDFANVCDLFSQFKIKHNIDDTSLTIEVCKSEESKVDFVKNIIPKLGIGNKGIRDKNDKNYKIFKTYLFRKDKCYIFKKKDYTCQVCGFKAPLLEIGPLKIPDWETSFKVPLGLDIHVMVMGKKKVAFVLCDKCHFNYHYYTKLEDTAIQNWKVLS